MALLVALMYFENLLVALGALLIRPYLSRCS